MVNPIETFKYYSTKTYGHDRGFTAVFRQPNATHSHCSLLHGYALAFSFKFGCHSLDDKNWVMDFGGLKELKNWLEINFDHTVVVDRNDPKIQDIIKMENQGLARVIVLDGVGCEKFAEHAFHYANDLVKKLTNNRVFCVSCEVKEHGANSAIYEANL